MEKTYLQNIVNSALLAMITVYDLKLLGDKNRNKKSIEKLSFNKI